MEKDSDEWDFDESGLMEGSDNDADDTTPPFSGQRFISSIDGELSSSAILFKDAPPGDMITKPKYDLAIDIPPPVVASNNVHSLQIVKEEEEIANVLIAEPAVGILVAPQPSTSKPAQVLAPVQDNGGCQILNEESVKPTVVHPSLPTSMIEINSMEAAVISTSTSPEVSISPPPPPPPPPSALSGFTLVNDEHDEKIQQHASIVTKDMEKDSDEWDFDESGLMEGSDNDADDTTPPFSVKHSDYSSIEEGEASSAILFKDAPPGDMITKPKYALPIMTLPSSAVAIDNVHSLQIAKEEEEIVNVLIAEPAVGILVAPQPSTFQISPISGPVQGNDMCQILNEESVKPTVVYPSLPTIMTENRCMHTLKLGNEEYDDKLMHAASFLTKDMEKDSDAWDFDESGLMEGSDNDVGNTTPPQSGKHSEYPSTEKGQESLTISYSTQPTQMIVTDPMQETVEEQRDSLGLAALTLILPEAIINSPPPSPPPQFKYSGVKLENDNHVIKRKDEDLCTLEDTNEDCEAWDFDDNESIEESDIAEDVTISPKSIRHDSYSKASILQPTQSANMNEINILPEINRNQKDKSDVTAESSTLLEVNIPAPPHPLLLSTQIGMKLDNVQTKNDHPSCKIKDMDEGGDELNFDESESIEGNSFDDVTSRGPILKQYQHVHTISLKSIPPTKNTSSSVREEDVNNAIITSSTQISAHLRNIDREMKIQDCSSRTDDNSNSEAGDWDFEEILSVNDDVDVGNDDDDDDDGWDFDL